MGIIQSKFNKKKIIPINLVSENKKLKKKCDELEMLLKKFKKDDNFECCVCYTNKIQNKKIIRCNHSICKSCYDLIPDKRCPLCRTKMKTKNKYLISII